MILSRPTTLRYFSTAPNSPGIEWEEEEKPYKYISTASGWKADVNESWFLAREGTETKDKYGNTPLHWAVEYHRDIAHLRELMTLFKKNINTPNKRGATPVFIAGFRSAEALELLIEHGADVKVVDKGGNTPLHYLAAAVVEPPVESIRLLVKKYHVPVNALTFEGVEPLMFACNFPEIVQELIDLGADAKAYEGFSMLHIHSAPEILKVLVNSGADLEASDADGLTPLMRAVQQKDHKKADTLCALGAKVDAVYNKCTSLIHACQNGDTEMVSLLLRHGADINLNLPGSALRNAVTHEHPEIVALLLRHKAHVNAKAADGATPLHEVRSVEIAKMLINAGANLEESDNEFRVTPIANAELQARDEIVEYLESIGARKNSDNGTSTPLYSQPGKKRFWGLGLGALLSQAWFKDPQKIGLTPEQRIAFNAFMQERKLRDGL